MTKYWLILSFLAFEPQINDFSRNHAARREPGREQLTLFRMLRLLPLNKTDSSPRNVVSDRAAESAVRMLRSPSAVAHFS